MVLVFSLFLANGLGVLLPKKTFLENYFCFTKGDATARLPMFLHGSFFSCYWGLVG